MKPFLVFGIVFPVFVTGCAGKVDYTAPYTYANQKNNIVIDSSIDEVWKRSVPELGKRFFVINNIDRDSGLINVSYSGSPEKYIDCGHVTSYVKNARGERTYSFPGESAQQTYEVMDGGYLFFVNREMSLEGRVNLIFEEVEVGKTRVTANTKYVVERKITVTNAANNIPHTSVQSISFNSGGSASFPLNRDGRTTSCTSKGSLEREILSVVK